MAPPRYGITHKHGLDLLNKAELQLRDVYVHLYKMKSTDAVKDMLFFRTEAYGVLTKVFQALALLNQTYFTKGWEKNMDQILQLPLKPVRLELLINAIMYAQSPADIQAACERLTKDTLECLLLKKPDFSDGPSYPKRMEGFYEEMKGVFDKIITFV
ncbi:hypothetical protein KSB_51650 [Ktedonobacter robiniae]|uniref:Uncharacterized protein n=1 Tax=Ktedonobacter robiniae TaxID=2778365 RepID=A0ABQ3UWA5_9CHLR|nr:hypothetical protein KSB_51650 [Ktedonobacter robiniae]